MFENTSQRSVNALGRCAETSAAQRCIGCAGATRGFCAGLDAATQAKVAARSRPLRLEKGQPAVREGESCADILTIAEGACRLHISLADGRRQIVGFRLAGETVTYPRRSVPWVVTVQALESSNLCRIDGRAIQELRGEHPDLNRSLDALAASEIDDAQSHMLTLGRRAPSERLASFLLDLRARRNGEEASPDEIELPMTRQDIADYLGLEIETTSRLFTRMKSDGLFSLPQPSRVVLQDEAGLRELAGGDVDGRRRSGVRGVADGALA